ncbi:nucleotide exchange factor GrpE [Nakamurella deserti]|uniref:nucleotide exchange factor GrpE n=1 Tax=Nakamurella deserti TaxID=2164074 RepID=UPI000DBE7E35|nr:nucleotide exchange factor GrpE [Nakamurella deserti]
MTAPDQNGTSSTTGTEEPHVVFRDKRRIDPDTGDVRDAAGNPFPAAGDPGDPAQAGQPIDAHVTADSEEVAKLATDLAERTADLQRVTAEYANYRKRVDRDREVATVTAKAAVVGELLGVLDDIELAQKHGDLTGAFKSVAERLIGTLERAGLKGFGAEGDPFDPAHHEAVQFGTSVDVDAPTVTSVFRRGYEFKERPLRAAVVVVTGPDQDAAPRPTNGDAVSTPDTPDSEAADEQDRVDDAKARAEQESKSGSVPDLDGDAVGSDGQPRPAEDPA